MAKTLNLEVVTPEKQVFSDEVQSIIVPAAEGYLGVLPNHAPLISGLKPGVVKYRQEGKTQLLAISGGFMEVSSNKVTILADTAERPEHIDIERARAARERAEKRLKERPPGLDVARAEFALQRAMARLRAAGLNG
ncbi:MAG: F0F1 ATP synthase subunit epsilon [Bacillota bacterium]